MKEWKDIPGFPIYEISSDGEIRNKKRQSILKGQINKKSGYVQYILYCFDEQHNKCKKGINVHRLVAKLFLPDFNEELDVNHIDGNKQNNSVSNLEMVSRSENLKHSFRLGLRANQIKEQKEKYGKAIIQYDLNGNKLNEFSSITEAAKVLGTYMQNISAAVNGRQKTAVGYIWRAKEVV